MRLKKNNFRFSIFSCPLSFFLLILMFFTLPVKAQVNIGADNPPNDFSLLELNTTEGGLRLPQLYESERDNILTPLFASNPDKAVGLVIYNMTSNCLEFWNGQKWVSLCTSKVNTLTVNPKNLRFHYTAENTDVSVITTVAGGWKVTYKPDWITVNPDLGTSSTGNTLNVSVAQNQDITARFDVIIVEAGSLSDTISVTQWGNPNTGNLANEGGGTPPTNTLTYVGAFWRASETGERVIKFNMGGSTANTGAWSASVVWIDSNWGPDDGVVLSLDKTTDPNFNTNNPDNAENYQVGGENLIVKGAMTSTTSNADVVFRIGLKSKYKPTDNNPARYAVVLFAYAGESKYQKIFLRQGEGADYLMINDDPVSGDLSQRTVCQRFSPYNLTADTLNRTVITQANARSGASGNKSKFTDFPTKAGAFFQWANTSTGSPSAMGMRWAIDPNTATWPTTTPSWSESSPSPTTYWDPTLNANNETCPPDYRRPTDGSTTGEATGNDISSSEIRQSLFKNPLKGMNTNSPSPNALWGYYADGYFDRRPLTSNTTVSSGTREVAYVGVLFFNPIIDGKRYNSSVFFPALGWRYYNATNKGSDGNLTQAGTVGYYWTSSMYNTQTSPATSAGWTLFLNSSTLGSWRVESPTGAAIRCVKNP